MKRRIYEKEKYSDQFSAAFSGSKESGIMYHCRLLISILPECGILCLFWCLRSVLCLQEKKGLRYGAIDLKEMKESKVSNGVSVFLFFC